MMAPAPPISCRASVLAVGLLLAAAVSASARPLTLTTLGSGGSTNATSGGGLSVYYHLGSCPQLETIVRSHVDAALRQNVRLTAGLLRVFFHDCFPQGCDASILLDNGERNLPPNVGLQQEVLQLIEDIRAKVHAQCGATVSCADITVLATRDAVNLAGGPAFTVPLGRLDSLAPASDNDVFKLPPPTATVDELLTAFKNAGLSDPADLVSLSGAHTVGKARCSSFGAVSGPAGDDITRCITETCSAAGSGDRLRDLDFLTPNVFDNLYFIELTLKKNQGVMLPSDQALVSDSRTSWLVQGFADNHWWFFDQFKTSMVKMSQLKGPQGNVGEVRRNCFRRNAAASLQDAGDEGLAAST
ncbi:cationic peroxidase SPC4-like isoform X3 [Panicum miliaceum]|uniref:Peroxidase n=1 Tax=Panicum miliaceum TaxID=4540 RepID=A0A3L6Q113_PANMI|nr:cationic peroxidase SPC4-like isoform X3 [Panicum miliaceum]